MSFFEKLLVFMESEMTEPTLYGWFHILSLVLLAVATFAVIRLFKGRSERAVSRFAMVVWIVLVLLEVYKQIVFTLEYENGMVEYDYQWYAFPYQFCSTPMYVLPLVAFLKEGRVRDGAIAYMSTFSLFAGFAVMLYPADVYVSTIGINIQTMIHHGSQILLGVFFIFRYCSRHSVKYFLRGVGVFAVTVAIALVMNVAVFNIFESLAIDETFNMFYISPYFDCTLPVLSGVYTAVPYPLFLIVYIFGFTFAGALVLYLVRLALVAVLRFYEKKRITA